jgi:N4-gp56 family major capsid protein
MALQTTTSVGLTDEMKTFYDRVLLERTVPKLLHAKFGQPKRIPAGGGRIIEWRKFDGLATATSPLTEGQLFTNLKDLTVTAITGTVAQYGDAVGFSDLVSTTTIDSLLTETTEILAEQAAETMDELCRDVLSAGTTVLYAATNVARNTIAAANVMTPAEVRRIRLQMVLNRTRPIGGAYQLLTHPRVLDDLINSTEWRDAQNYHQTGRIFDGSVGELYGVRFWETDKAKVFADAGAGSTVDVYTALCFGQDAFGIVNLAGHNLQTVFKPLGSAGTADPLNQQQTMGWKVTFGVKILQQGFMLRWEGATSSGSNT